MNEHQALISSIKTRLLNSETSVADLRFIWQTRDDDLWHYSPELYRLLAERIFKQGEPFLAYDVAVKGLDADAQSLKLKHIRALSLSQSGAPGDANLLLSNLVSEGHDDAETLSLLARTYKDLWTLEGTECASGKNHLEEAYRLYLKAFEKSNTYYPGINAATMALLTDKKEEASRLAREVLAICTESEKKDQSYWLKATLGEAYLLLNDIKKASIHYALASQQARSDPRSLCSIRKQARLLLKKLTGDRHLLDSVFGVGVVAVFSGHIVDAADREKPRFPANCEAIVKKAIQETMQTSQVSFAYASAASGSDILFLEVAEELGIEFHIVLPFSDESFRQVSVRRQEAPHWEARYQRLLSKAASVTYLSQDDYSGDGIDFDITNHLITGLALLKSQVMDAEVKAITVWDGLEGDNVGGTADSVKTWRSLKLPISIVSTQELCLGANETQAVCSRQEQAPTTENIQSGYSAVPKKMFADVTRTPFSLQRLVYPGESRPKAVQREFKAVLFSDIVGFSEIKDSEIALFYEHYLLQAGLLLERTSYKPCIRNTWGDALYLVFDTVSLAGNFALELRNWFRTKDWKKLGFARHLDIRIALHAGPVNVYTDPVTQMLSCTGYHVSRGARIEPITKQGLIYASESFAALSLLDTEGNYFCDYVGEIQLAKKYGNHRIYVLRGQEVPNLTLN